MAEDEGLDMVWASDGVYIGFTVRLLLCIKRNEQIEFIDVYCPLVYSIPLRSIIKVTGKKPLLSVKRKEFIG